MTQGEKAKAYDKALETARKINSGEGVASPPDWAICELIFPELKESEDERMSKAICYILNNTAYSLIEKTDFTVSQMIAWLKKQGNTNKTIDRDEIAQGVLRGAAINLITWIDYNAAEGNMCLSNNECKDIEDALVNGDWNKIYAYIKEKLEKQGEQKPTDEVEPKFKVGDWIVYKNDICQIIKREEGCNKLVTIFGIEKELVNERNLSTARLWTIKDAKDGDVLHSPSHHLIWIYKGNEHYHVCVNMNYVSENVTTDGLISIPNDVCPATKDEQTILFVRIKEAGYEWDEEKKEVKKIEHKIEVSEDKKIIKAIIGHIKDLLYYDMYYDVTPDEMVAWLEKQNEKPKKISIWKHWKDGIAGNGEGKQVFLIKIGSVYSISSCLGCECDYIELSELNELMKEEKQGKLKWSEEDEVGLCDALWAIEQAKTIVKNENEMGNLWYAEKWLKSIKKKMEE